MIFYGGAIQNNFENISSIVFSNSENEKLKNFLIDQIKSNKNEKEIESETFKAYHDQVKRIVDNANLNSIISKKNYNQIKELFDDLTSDLIESQNKKKIESLEKKLINNMEEQAYSEFIKLKSQINRD